MTNQEASYTDKHETDINAIQTADKDYCVDCGVRILFNNDFEAFEEVDKGRDTSFVSPTGIKFDLLHDMSISFVQDPSEFYPEGLYCSECGNEIIAPSEEE
jgi:hypothetical protein